MNETIARAAEFMKTAGCCVLALIDADGYPTAATITPTKMDGIQSICFGNALDSNWAQRSEKCNRASICFHSVRPEVNITLVGTIEIVTDLNIKKEAWSQWMEMYYSGPEDPRFCVLRFETRRYSLYVEGTQLRGTLSTAIDEVC